MSKLSILMGRFLLGFYFLLPGVAKLLSPEQQLQLMESYNIPFAQPLLIIAGVSSLLGAAALMSGRYVKLAAFGFVIYVLLVNILLHPFWAVESEMQNFFKNMGILSGLLILAGHTPSRKPALKDWWKSDAAIARE